MPDVTAWRNRIVGEGEQPASQFIANPNNWRTHPQAQRDAMRGALNEVGWVQRVIVNRRTGYLVDGHERVWQALQNGDAPVPYVEVDLSPEEEAYVLATLDPIGAMAQADKEQLDALLREVQSGEAGVQAMLAELAEDASLYAQAEETGEIERSEQQARATLAERFLVPPFSVLDARQGYWQERKRAWLALGIQSELGRGEHALGEMRSTPPHGPTVTLAHDGSLRYRESNGTSIFDPVLCELAYRWFCPPGGAVLDPFAGGSVRGIVAAKLGRRYTGIDLSERQVAANEEQATTICVPGSSEETPRWIVGDSADVRTIAPGDYDLLFTCPPYADLEVYSDDPRDLSTMEYSAFTAKYRGIIGESIAMLKQDRFACIVVGDVRDSRTGCYRNFVADTIAAFQDAGAVLYNEAVLVTAVGSLPIRVGRQFEAGRKLGKTHQNVLVFVKGDPRKATAACGPVDVAMPDDMESAT